MGFSGPFPGERKGPLVLPKARCQSPRRSDHGESRWIHQMTPGAGLQLWNPKYPMVYHGFSYFSLKNDLFRIWSLDKAICWSIVISVTVKGEDFCPFFRPENQIENLVLLYLFTQVIPSCRYISQK